MTNDEIDAKRAAQRSSNADFAGFRGGKHLALVPCMTLPKQMLVATDFSETSDAALDYAIHSVANEVGADLIVIGTHGRKGLAHALLGSVAEKIIRTATRPVLTIHGPRSS